MTKEEKKQAQKTDGEASGTMAEDAEGVGTPATGEGAGTPAAEEGAAENGSEMQGQGAGQLMHETGKELNAEWVNADGTEGRGTFVIKGQNEDGTYDVVIYDETTGETEVERYAAEDINAMVTDEPTVEVENAEIGSEGAEKWTLSENKAANGENFYQDRNGNIDLVRIPDEVFDAIGYTNAPLRLTPSMVKHVRLQHGKETGITTDDEAIAFVTDVMQNFDHVRLGDNGALIFSVENGRNRTGKRAITILLGSGNGDFYGVKTSGYEGIDRLQKRPLLWEGSAKESSIDAASTTVTSSVAQQGSEQSGSASVQSNGIDKFSSNSSDMHLAENRNGLSDLLPTQEENGISGGKGSENNPLVQGNGENSAVLGENSASAAPRTQAQQTYDAIAQEWSYVKDATERQKSIVGDINATIEGVKRKMEKVAAQVNVSVDLTDAKAVQKRSQARAELQQMQQTLDFWNEVKGEYNAQMQKAMAERAAKEAEEAAEFERRKAELAAQKKAEEEAAKAAAAAGATPIERKWNAAPKYEGRKKTINLPDGTTLSGHYVLTTAGAATASHDPFRNYASSEGFPTDEAGNNVNDRDYQGDATQRKETELQAAQYDGRAIDSMPVVSKRGIVYSGNGRTMAGDIAAKNGTDKAYVEQLRADADMYGFTPEQVAEMGEHPRLLFVPEEELPYTTVTFAKFNVKAEKGQGNTAKAVKASKQLSEQDVQTIVGIMAGVDGEGGYANIDSFFSSEKGTNDLILALQERGILQSNEVADYVEDGKFNNAGKDFVKNLLLGTMFDADAIKVISTVPSVKNALVSAMNPLLENTRLGDYSTKNEISNAARLIAEAKGKGYSSVADYMRQTSLFGQGADQYTDFEKALAVSMDGGVESFRTQLGEYNKTAAMEKDGSIFGAMTPEEVKAAFVDNFNNEEEPMSQFFIKSDRYGLQRGNRDGNGVDTLAAVPRRTQDLLDLIGKQLGYTIAVEEFEQEGMAEPWLRKITLSLEHAINKPESAMRKILGHELTHVIKSLSKDFPELWDAYLNSVKTAMTEEEFEAEAQEIMDIYNRNIARMRKQNPAKWGHVKDITIEAAREEVASNFAGEHIFTDKEFVKDMLDEVAKSSESSASIARRVLNYISNLLKRIKSAVKDRFLTAEENRMIETLEGAKQLWKEMYKYAAAKEREAQEVEDEQQSKFSMLPDSQSNKDEAFVRRNIESGMNALRALANGETSVRGAMNRPELAELGGTSEITIDWGTQGKITPDGRYKGGSGLLKIIDKHGVGEAIEMVNTIARGEIGTPYGPDRGKRVNILNEDRQAVISLYRNNAQESWVITAYKNESNADAKGRGSDLNSATLSDPIRTRAELVAALDSFEQASNKPVSGRMIDLSSQAHNEQASSQSLVSGDKSTQKNPLVQENGEKSAVSAQNNDADYLKAVESGDTETAERMVKAAVKAAMPETKVVDENGEPLVVYHGTPEKFNSFDIDKIGSATDSGFYGMGFYFAKDNTEAKVYGENVLPVYLNLRNPLDLNEVYGKSDKWDGDQVDGTVRWWYGLADMFPKEMESVVYEDYESGEDWSIVDMKNWINERSKTSDTPFQDFVDEYHLDEDFYDVLEESDINIPEEFTEAAKKYGYDGVINGGIHNNEMVAFYPEQIKSADPVTRDDDGKVIPLSERFNKDMDDIRFSIQNLERELEKETSPLRQAILKAKIRNLEEQEVKFSIQNAETTAAANREAWEKAKYSQANPNSVVLMKDGGSFITFGSDARKVARDLGMEDRMNDGKLVISMGEYLKLKDTKRDDSYGIKAEYWSDWEEWSHGAADVVWKGGKVGKKNVTELLKDHPELQRERELIKNAKTAEEQVEAIDDYVQTLSDMLDGEREDMTIMQGGRAAVLEAISEANEIREKVAGGVGTPAEATFAIESWEPKAKPSGTVVKAKRAPRVTKKAGEKTQKEWQQTAPSDEKMLQRPGDESMGEYYDDDNQALAHAVKRGEKGAIKEAARRMALWFNAWYDGETVRYAEDIGNNYNTYQWILVPVPSHDGKATYTKKLAEEISKLTGIPVADALSAKPHKSAYESKAQGEQRDKIEPSVNWDAIKTAIDSKERKSVLTKNPHPILIDNVRATGETLDIYHDALSNKTEQKKAGLDDLNGVYRLTLTEDNSNIWQIGGKDVLLSGEETWQAHAASRTLPVDPWTFYDNYTKRQELEKRYDNGEITEEEYEDLYEDLVTDDYDSGISIDNGWVVFNGYGNKPGTAVHPEEIKAIHDNPWQNVQTATVHSSNIRKRFPQLHESAKHGDVMDAAKLVSEVVDSKKIAQLQAKYPEAIVAYPHAENRAGRNAIPSAFADKFADAGFEVDDSIVQTNRVYRTDANKFDRLIKRARFDGEVQAGREYILVDDHITSGATMRDMKDYIESRGGKVVAVQALEGSAGATKMAITPELKEQLINNGVTDEQLKDLGISRSVENLTAGEARELLNLSKRGRDFRTKEQQKISSRRSQKSTRRTPEEIARAERSRADSERARVEAEKQGFGKLFGGVKQKTSDGAADLEAKNSSKDIAEHILKKMQIPEEKKEQVKTGVYQPKATAVGKKKAKPTTWVQLELDFKDEEPRSAGTDESAGTPTAREAVGEPSGKTEGTVAAKKAKAKKTPEDFRLRPLKEGETCLVERRYVESGSFGFTGSEKIESPDDVAYIFRNLEDSAIENVFFALIKNGKVTIIHAGMGCATESMADKIAPKLAIENINPDSIVMVHNHPSGTLRPSRADENLHKSLVKMYGDKVRDSIIIDQKSGKYAEFNTSGLIGESERPTTAKNEVAYKTYSFSKNVFAPDYSFEEGGIANMADIAAFISSHRLGDRGKLGVLILSNNLHVNGNIFLDANEINADNCVQIAKDIVSACASMSGKCVIIHGNGGMEYGRLAQLKSNVEHLSDGYFRLIDAVKMDGNHEHTAVSLLNEPGPEYGNIKPVGKGAFGNIYDQFKGKAKEAVAFLLSKKEGEAIGALHHKDVGDIDLVWGKEGTSKSDGYGLAKLAKFHPEVLTNLQEVLNDMVVTKRTTNRVQLESATHQAAVRLTWDNQKKNWLLTAFEKKNSVSDNTTDTVGTAGGGKLNDTATQQNTVFGGKGSENNPLVQESESDFSREGRNLDYSTRQRIEKLRREAEEESSPLRKMILEAKARNLYNEVIAKAEGETELNPTGAQKEAGNYKKGHLRIDGYDISIENPKGSTRSGKDADGKAWSVTMHNTYGYIRGTEGVDGDHIDIYLSDNPFSGNVFVIDQVNADGSFDEHKVMYGFETAEEARENYLANYSEGWTGLGTITEVTKEEFQKWVKSSHRKTKPFAEYKSVKAEGAQHAEIGKAEPISLNLNGVDYDVRDIEDSVRADVERVIRDGDFDAEIVGVKVIGSRMRGEERADSDLDVLVEYTGRAREDSLFDAIADEALEINGVKVDVNPITRYKSGTIEQFMERNAGFSKNAEIGEPEAEYGGGRERSGRFATLPSSKPFYSNAARAVEDIKQQKATPEQWLKMIEKNGGLKKGEDKWMGLSDWLKERAKLGAKTLTKDEVMEYIRQNTIQIEEVEYGDSEKIRREGLAQLREEFEQVKNEILEEGNGMTVEDAQKVWDDFGNEMYDKYGGAFMLHLTPEEKKRNDELREAVSHAKHEYSSWELADEAFSRMIGKYGSDFDDGFKVEAGKLYLDADDATDGVKRSALRVMGHDLNPISDVRMNYTTPGLENKHEIALTVPNIEPYGENDEVHFGDAGGGRAVAWVRFGDARDGDGSRVLVIDEIQSRRHQDGREKGYKEDVEVKGNVGNYEKVTDKLAYADVTNDNGIMIGQVMRQNGKYVALDQRRQRIDFNRYDTEAEALAKIEENAGLDPDSTHVPDAPFDKNWHELAMKRMLRYAAENGYDKVAWTTGMQQAARYNIGGVVPFVDVTTDPHPAVDERARWKTLRFEANGNACRVDLNTDGKVILAKGLGNDAEGKDVKELFGREVGEKILQSTSKYGAPDRIQLEGVEVGGEGMKGFYDQMLPKFMQKYGKKWGATVGEVELDLPNSADRKMWSVDITPEMRESVRRGQPMFYIAPDAGSLSAGWEDPEIERNKMTYLQRLDEAKNEANQVLTRLGGVELSAQSADAERKNKLLKPEQQSEARKAVAKFVNAALSTDNMSVFSKRALKGISSKVAEAKTTRMLRKHLMEAEAICNDAEVARLKMQIDKLLKMKVQDMNDKGISVGKLVDDETRKVFEYMKGRTEELRRTEVDDELKAVGAELREIEKTIKEALYEYGIGDAADRDERNAMVDANPSLTTEYDGEQHTLAELKAMTEPLIEQQKELKEQKAEIQAGNRDNLANWHDRMNELQYRFENSEEEDVKPLSESEKREYEGLMILDAINEADKLAYTTQVREDGQLQESIKSIQDQKNELFEKNRQLRMQLGENYGRDDMYIKMEINKNNNLIDNLTLAENAIKEQQIDFYRQAADAMKELIQNGMSKLMEQKEAEKERKSYIAERGYYDVKKGNEWGEGQKQKTNMNTVKDFFFLSPLQSFEFMSQWVSNMPAGRGYLYNYFTKNLVRAEEQLATSIDRDTQKLNDKCQELFGCNFKQASERYGRSPWHPFRKYDSGIYVMNEDGSSMVKDDRYTDMPKGTALQFWMWWQNPDGRMKMQAMGFNEESIQQIENYCGPKLLEFGQWLFNFYEEMGDRTNEVHKMIYNTSMHRVPNYSPLKINDTAISEKNDLAAGDNAFSKSLNKTNGSLINRTVNTLPLSTERTAFDIVAEHMNANEELIAFGRVRKDLDYLLNSMAFRNTLNANKSGNYNDFVNAALVAAHLTRESFEGGDKVYGAIMSGFAAGAIGYRIWTGIKQVMSYPAFYAYKANPRYWADVTARFWSILEAKPTLIMANIHWASENLPLFKARWNEGLAGNQDIVREVQTLDNQTMWGRIREKYGKYGMLWNRFVDAMTCAAGARAIYDFEYRRLKKHYLNSGASAEEAHNLANHLALECANNYNTTQQSSVKTYISPEQDSKTALNRVLGLFQNSNRGFSRQGYLGAKDILGAMDSKKRAFWVQRYMDDIVLTKEQAQGKSEEEKAKLRKSMAEKMLAEDIATAVGKFAMCGFGIKWIWDRTPKIGKAALLASATPAAPILGGAIAGSMIGASVGSKAKSPVIGAAAGGMAGSALGFALGGSALAAAISAFISTILEDDEADGDNNGKVMEILNEGAKWASYFPQGTVGGNMAHDWLWSNSIYDPFSIVGQSESESIKKAYDKYGWSPELAAEIMRRVPSVQGFNMDTYTNIYIGAKDLVDNGYSAHVAIDVMLMLNCPSSMRKDVASTMYKDYSLEEYTSAMVKARKLAGRGRFFGQFTGTHDVNKSDITEINEEWMKNNIGADVVTSFKELNKQDGLLHQIGQYQTGMDSNSGTTGMSESEMEEFEDAHPELFEMKPQDDITYQEYVANLRNVYSKMNTNANNAKKLGDSALYEKLKNSQMQVMKEIVGAVKGKTTMSLDTVENMIDEQLDIADDLKDRKAEAEGR